MAAVHCSRSIQLKNISLCYNTHAPVLLRSTQTVCNGKVGGWRQSFLHGFHRKGGVIHISAPSLSHQRLNSYRFAIFKVRCNTNKKNENPEMCRGLQQPRKEKASQTVLLPLHSIAPYYPAIIFHQGRYQTQMCGERKGERGENNYPLHQPAGLFINTQL